MTDQLLKDVPDPNSTEIATAVGPDPIPEDDKPLPRKGIALCLSGGGFRAALFHLGALRRLNELGILSKVNTFSCVSGGSIIGAHLARKFKETLTVSNGVIQDWKKTVEDTFLPFVAQDIRTAAVAERLKLWKRNGGLAPRKIQAFYEKLTDKMHLRELPSKPRFIFCASNLVFANSWVAERWRVGDYLSGYVTPPPDHWTVAKAVAASSCFPPIFDPLPPDIDPSQYRPPKRQTLSNNELNALRSQVELTDGGVYDNLGLEPVWKSHETILVSDGGKPLQRKYVPPGKRLMRYSDVIQNQVGSLRKRWLIDTFKRATRTGTNPYTYNGTYWGIMSATKNYVDANPGFGYSDDLAKRWIANIRTDLDPFSPNEIVVLTKHGYELAEMAIRTHMPTLAAHPNAPLQPWSARLLNEATVESALSGSVKRSLLGRDGRQFDDDLLH